MECYENSTKAAGRSRGVFILAAILALAALILVPFLVSTDTGHAAFPGANGKIVFVRGDVSGTDEIFITNPDGTGQTQLTINSDQDGAPSWSPDGTEIAFHSNRGDRKFRILVMNADGTSQLGLSIPVEGTSPVWSPDSTQFAFDCSPSGNNDVCVADTDGSNLINLTSTSPAFDGQPDWSPDGNQIAFMTRRDSNDEIYVMNADGSGTPTRLTNNGVLDAAPNWSPDGTQIAFNSDELNVNGDIFVMNADGTGRTSITNLASLEDGAAWSPDGEQIAFWSNRASGSDIFIMNADGSSQARLTFFSGNFFASGADWQPLVVVPIAVQIDIKPGSDPNCFNLNGNGVIPVAILGSADFDATEVDAGFEPGATTGALTGDLLDGTPFEGSDTICIVP